MIEQDLWQHLTDNVPLVSGRIYQLTFPQNLVKPAILITLVSDTSIQNEGLSSLGSRSRIQLDIYDETFYDSKAVKDEVLAALATFEPKPQNINATSTYEDDVYLYRDIIDFVCIDSSSGCV